MNYKQVKIPTQEAAVRDMLIAVLSSAGFEGFEEQDDLLLAFVPEDQYSEEGLRELLLPFAADFEVSLIEKRNWNKQWEEHFQPVIVPGLCTIRADFHEVTVNTPFEIIITPKMSFGTGHHGTTRLMMQMLGALDLRGRQVFDFGTGTGILSILAEKLGAAGVVALDNDEWSFENAGENVARNRAVAVDVRLGTIEDVSGSFDVILANINRHILLDSMARLYQLIVPGGIALLSGLLLEDEQVIRDAAEQEGFVFIERKAEGNWIAIRLVK